MHAYTSFDFCVCMLAQVHVLGTFTEFIPQLIQTKPVNTEKSVRSEINSHNKILRNLLHQVKLPIQADRSTLETTFSNFSSSKI